MPELPAVPGKATDNDIEGTLVGIQDPAVARCIGPGPAAYFLLGYFCLFRGVTGNAVLSLFRLSSTSVNFWGSDRGSAG